jgi:hypothetical protein
VSLLSASRQGSAVAGLPRQPRWSSRELRVAWFRIRPRASRRVAVVVEHSTRSQKHMPAIYEETVHLLQALRDHECTVRLLGDRAGHCPDDLGSLIQNQESADQWRVSLIGPVYESLKEDSPDVVVVIAAGRIFDLEDWLASPILKKTLFVWVGDDLLTERRKTQQEFLYVTGLDAMSLRNKITTPIREVEITGRSFMPFLWDAAEYSFEWRETEAALGGPGSGDGDLAIRVGGFIAQKEVPTARTATRESGELCWAEAAVVADSPWEPSVKWTRMTPSESTAVDQLVAGRPYTCPLCESEHPAGGIRCRSAAKRQRKLISGGLIDTGPLVFRSAGVDDSADRLTGFLLLRRARRHHQCAIYPYQAIRLAGDAVAVRTDTGKACVYEYSPDSGNWKERPVQPNALLPISRSTYASPL